MDETFANTSLTDGAVVAEEKADGVLPMFIKQIHDQGDGIKLFGMTFNIATFVGIVRSVDHSSTKITYKVEDHTGRIDCHLWIEDDDSNFFAPRIISNSYAKVYGSVRHQGDEITIMIFKIEPIVTINELTTHLLEVLAARYKSEDFSKPKGIENNFGYDTTNHLGLKGKHLQIYQEIRSCTKTHGISKAEIQSKFSYMSAEEIKTIMEFLYHEGHIFTSIDADHVLATE